MADDFNACHDESCWSRTISPVAAKVPVVVTECGFSIPWAQGLWRWIEQQHGSISYLAWTWNTCESRHGIAGTWVAFFQECQQYRCGQGAGRKGW